MHSANTESSFPERQFACPIHLSGRYEELVAMGRQRMSQRRIIIAGLARDIRVALPSTAARIERLGEMFKDYRVVIFENDSLDGTLGYLRGWQQENRRVTVLTDVLDTPRWQQVPDLRRAAQMAHYRQQYLNLVQTDFHDWDYLIVVDTDLPDGFSYDGIANSFGHDGWDVMGSYGVQLQNYLGIENYPVFFDVWAFRDVGRVRRYEVSEINPRIYQRGDPLLPVWSCFGGAAIYRMQAACSGAQYEGSDCEHVPFHRQLRQRGFRRIFMNPSQIVLYPPPEN